MRAYSDLSHQDVYGMLLLLLLQQLQLLLLGP
jgi:hypothetical protein